MASPLSELSPIQCCLPCEKELSLKLYLHQVGRGDTANQKQIAPTPEIDSFGATYVNNWAIADAPDFKAKVIGHAQGITSMTDQARLGWYTSFNLKFEDGSFKGSTLQVMGIISSVIKEGEWAIVGGTGELSMARGTIQYKEVLTVTPENIRELDVHGFYTPKVTPAVKGTVAAASTNGQGA